MPGDEDAGPQQVKATKEEVAEEAAGELGAADVKIILLGDSAVGKSKLVERYLMGDYHPRQLSTFALTLYRKEQEVEDDDGKPKNIQIDFWDTAGQERFNSMHPSYYFQAHACILVFDVTRKNTYKHLQDWFDELKTFREEIPIICVANKIDANYSVTKKKFKFPIENKVRIFLAAARPDCPHGCLFGTVSKLFLNTLHLVARIVRRCRNSMQMPFFFVSAADGTNVVQMFEHAIKAAWEHKKNPVR